MVKNCNNRNLPLEGGGTEGVTNNPSESSFSLNASSLRNLPLEGGGTEGVTNNPSESYLSLNKPRVIKTHPLLGLCRYNRKNKTTAEKKLWHALRANKLGLPFRQQQQIGTYIVDFVCLQAKLVIECDGSQHYKIVDAERTRFLESEGYTVLRFWNNEILSNLESCITQIQKLLMKG